MGIKVIITVLVKTGLFRCSATDILPGRGRAGRRLAYHVLFWETRGATLHYGPTPKDGATRSQYTSEVLLSLSVSRSGAYFWDNSR